MRTAFLVVGSVFLLAGCTEPIRPAAGGSEHHPSLATTPARPFTVAAAVGIPGVGGPGPAPCGTNPAYLNPVLLFGFDGGGPLTPLPTIPPCPASFVNDPIYVAFDHRGELFVANRGGGGSIARFVFAEDGTFVANGAITDPALVIPVRGLAFSRMGELFAASGFTRRIARFRFDPHGAAVANGGMTAVANPFGLAFSRDDELFTTAFGTRVFRYVLDREGTATPNGSFLVPGSRRLHGIAFSPQGELFVSDIDTDGVYRFRFDAAGDPLPNGFFAVAGGPIGLAFSPRGELFVSGHFAGGIHRFVFDADGTPVPNGSLATPQLGGVAVFP